LADPGEPGCALGPAAAVSISPRHERMQAPAKSPWPQTCAPWPRATLLCPGTSGHWELPHIPMQSSP